MRLVSVLLLAAAMFLGVAIAAAAPAAAQDDETGYSIDSEDGDSDAGYSASSDDTQVLGTTLSRTGANSMLLVLIGGATIVIGIGLDRWSTRLEPQG